MASNINADNGVVSGSAGLKTSADSSGVLALQTNGTTAVTVDTSQNVTFANSASLPNTFGFKNRLINGAMVIDQRNAGATLLAMANNTNLIDRYRFTGSASVASKLNFAQNLNSVTGPTGFPFYSGFQTASAYTVTGSDIAVMEQIIEGYNIQDLAWGTSDAKPITISFWVRSSLTGTFGGCLKNAGYSTSYPFTYTISTANTWTYVSINITAPTTGTWNTTNGQGIRVMIGLGVGATSSGTASNSWISGDYYSATGAVSILGTASATFYITGFQVEKGTQATSFDVRSYTNELQLCQRYCTTINDATTSGYIQGYGGGCRGVTYIGVTIPLPTAMRATPSLSNVGGTVRLTVGNSAVDSASSSMTIGGVTPTIGYSANSGNLALTYIGGPVTGLSGITNNVCVTFFTNGDGKLFAFSEL